MRRKPKWLVLEGQGTNQRGESFIERLYRFSEGPTQLSTDQHMYIKALPGTGKRATGNKLEKTFFGAYMGPEKKSVSSQSEKSVLHGHQVEYSEGFGFRRGTKLALS